ncbi:heavy-metal-associated domain-containing protein [Paeniglutamicibacter antarcticus]|uniref:HMA domain-containing protein n=1 Tax=Paeniglutamicibacter antarcticus TaxID=494023 RepID=A0ABP9TJE4_9MICC
MSDSEGCGCGGCGCGSSEDSGLTITVGPPQDTNAQTHTILKINGMTCGHCVASVTEELREIDGVTDVEVILSVGGTSTANITSSGPLDDALLAQAVDEAGYSLA